MRAWLTEHFWPLIIGLVMVISVVGMAEFKLLEETSQEGSYGVYFNVFRLLFFSGWLYWLMRWLFGMWKEFRQLKNERLEAELSLLKSKIDPHFFFNTLNNLYGLAIVKSAETPRIILKLSEIMRYTIYEGEKDTVALCEEVNYLKQFIEIHRIRHKSELAISFDVSVEREDARIAPLLLIMILENAFKHGIERLNRGAYIRVQLEEKDHRLRFRVENNFDPTEEKSPGMGLKNLRRRLQLIYPAYHQLDIRTVGEVHFAQLSIQL